MKISLRDFGWEMNKSRSSRRKALNEAIKFHGIIRVRKRLDDIRKLQSIPENREIFAKDVEYLDRMYEKMKKKMKKKMKGGHETQGYVNEIHRIDGKKILFFTIDKRDANDVRELREKNGCTKRDDESNVKIGIKVNGQLKGLCSYEENEKDASIVEFCCQSDYCDALYLFIERYLSDEDFQTMTANKDSGQTDDFWKRHGFNKRGERLAKELTQR